MTLLGRKIKASDLFVQALENEGVEFIFALPGDVSQCMGSPALLSASPVSSKHSG